MLKLVFTEKFLKEPLMDNYALNRIINGLIEQFKKVKKYRNSLGLDKPYENRLIFENIRKIEKAKNIDKISRQNGLEPYLLTLMPINQNQQKEITKYLSKVGLSYFGSIEFSDKNSPHLHLTIYFKTKKEQLKLKKAVKNILNIKRDTKKRVHIQPIGDGATYSIKDIFRETKLLSNIRDNIDDREFLDFDILDNVINDFGIGDETESQNLYKTDENSDDLFSTPFEDLQPTESEISSEPDFNITLDDIQKYAEKNEFKRVRSSPYNQFFCFKNYIYKKALLKYFGFPRRFLSSKVPPEKVLNSKAEAKKVKKQIIKSRKLQDIDGQKYLIEIENITKEEQLKLTRFLSAKKVKFQGSLTIKGGKPFLKLEITIPETTLFPEIFEESIFNRIEKIFEKRAVIKKVEDSKILSSLKRDFQKLNSKNLAFIKSYSNRKERLNKFGFSRISVISRI